MAGDDLKAVLFDVDFTLARPGPELGPEGYVRVGRRHGIELDVSRHDEARAAALETLQKHPDVRHDEERCARSSHAARRRQPFRRHPDRGERDHT